MSELTLNALENWLWEAACVVRGPLDAPKFKDYILPLVFLKRLSDVFDDEVGRLAREIGSTRERALELAQGDHKVVWFFIPAEAQWDAVSKKTTDVGEYLTDAVRAVARENPKLQGVIDVRDFNETAAGQRMVLEEGHVGQISALLADWKAAEGLSAIILREQVVESDYNLSPSRYVVVDNEEEVLPLEEAVVLLREAEEERAVADRKLNEVLKELGLGPIHGDAE